MNKKFFLIIIFFIFSQIQIMYSSDSSFNDEIVLSDSNISESDEIDSSTIESDEIVFSDSNIFKYVNSQKRFKDKINIDHINFIDEQGIPFIISVCRNNNDKLFKYLLQFDELNVNAQTTKTGLSLLHLLVTSLDQGFDEVSKFEKHVKTNKKMLKHLLARPDINIALLDNEDRMPIDYASLRNIETINNLINKYLYKNHN